MDAANVTISPFDRQIDAMIGTRFVFVCRQVDSEFVIVGQFPS
jgi:hypothetical protein